MFPEPTVLPVCIWLDGVVLLEADTPLITVGAVPVPPFITGTLRDLWYTPPPTPLAPEVETRMTFCVWLPSVETGAPDVPRVMLPVTVIFMGGPGSGRPIPVTCLVGVPGDGGRSLVGGVGGVGGGGGGGGGGGRGCSDEDLFLFLLSLPPPPGPPLATVPPLAPPPTPTPAEPPLPPEVVVGISRFSFGGNLERRACENGRVV